MGKKPAVALFGLIWSAIALTGCGECCRNCHNKFSPSPTFSSKNKATNTPSNPTPTMVGDARPSGVETKTNELAKQVPARGADNAGTIGYPMSPGMTPGVELTSGTSAANSNVVPAVNTSNAAPAPVANRPEDLRGGEDRGFSSPTSLPPRQDRSRTVDPNSRMGFSSEPTSMPPRPVIPASSEVGSSAPCPTGKCATGSCPGGNCPTGHCPQEGSAFGNKGTTSAMESTPGGAQALPPIGNSVPLPPPLPSDSPLPPSGSPPVPSFR